MTCSGNLFKHLKNCYQIETNRKMFQHDSQKNFKSNDFFLPKKSDQIFPFHIHFPHLCKISNQKKIDYECVFEFFQSHCHILKELHEFLHMMNAITIFEKK
jgi:hypothetical protein